MTHLSAISLADHNMSLGYNRNAVTAGIVHFGIGNFHRAHQAVYCDDLLCQGETRWGITGVSLRSSSMQEALAPQDYLYTLAVLGRTMDCRVIGAVKDILVAPQNPQAVVDRLAQSSTQLVSSTITEKGYALKSNRVDFSHPDLAVEVTSLEAPKTIYGFLARGLIARQSNAPTSKLTILCCDNISGGGEYLRQGVEHLLHIHSPETLVWAQGHITFVSSMVDRVCPATDDGLRAKVHKETGLKDAWPVSAEPFTQWIIEGDFAGARPAFDKVGAVFVDDIAPFERMKLRYLNAAHTMASTLGHLFGDQFVHQALERKDVLTFMRQALYKNVLPNAAVPEGYNGEDYIESVIARFQNENLPYANLQVGTDSSQKIQQRWFPTIDRALERGEDASYFEFCLGAWGVFIQTALSQGVLNDPKRDTFKQAEQGDVPKTVMAYLEIANAQAFIFAKDAEFMGNVYQRAENIKAIGIEAALIAFLSAQKI